MKRNVPIYDRIANVARSPRVAAIGVAMLSGFIRNRKDNKMITVKNAPLRDNKSNLIYNLYIDKNK
jgi:hypothetical protein